jgi:hypothetical protein
MVGDFGSNNDATCNESNMCEVTISMVWGDYNGEWCYYSDAFDEGSHCVGSYEINDEGLWVITEYGEDDCEEYVFELDSEIIDYALDLHYGANLLSFYALPDDNSLGNMMASLGDNVTGIIGEGVAASPNPVFGWVGSLNEIDPLSGYWVKVNTASILEIEEAIPTDASSALYSLHYGANLISFPSDIPTSVGSAIPDAVEDAFSGFLGEGVATSQIPGMGWVGSLSSFEGGK